MYLEEEVNAIVSRVCAHFGTLLHPTRREEIKREVRNEYAARHRSDSIEEGLMILIDGARAHLNALTKNERVLVDAVKGAFDRIRELTEQRDTLSKRLDEYGESRAIDASVSLRMRNQEQLAAAKRYATTLESELAALRERIAVRDEAFELQGKRRKEYETIITATGKALGMQPADPWEKLPQIAATLREQLAAAKRYATTLGREKEAAEQRAERAVEAEQEALTQLARSQQEKS